MLVMCAYIQCSLRPASNSAHDEVDLTIDPFERLLDIRRHYKRPLPREMEPGYKPGMVDSARLGDDSPDSPTREVSPHCSPQAATTDDLVPEDDMGVASMNEEGTPANASALGTLDEDGFELIEGPAPSRPSLQVCGERCKS